MRIHHLGVAIALVTGPAHAQDTRPDTASLGAVVIVAERSATPMNRSTAAVTRLTAADLARLPNASVADVLASVPGFAVVTFDGLGRDPQLMVRGFYGGGEAEYIQVMVDGRPVNLVHNGTIAWETLPPIADIESIEIVRGSASAIHGDAAVAGVVNIVTRRGRERSPAWRMESASVAGLSAGISLPATLGNDMDTEAAVRLDHSDGFRDHAARSAVAVRGKLRFSPALRVTALKSWRRFDEPGPLLERFLFDGSESDPRFGKDRGEDNEWDTAISHDGVLGAGGTLRTTLRLGGREGTLVRTLPLAPDFGDTRERSLSTINAGVTTQADLNPTILPFGERLSVGASADLGTIDSRYHSDTGTGPRRLDAKGNGSRAALGAFVHLAVNSREWLRWTFGLRADLLGDAFDPGAGGEDFSESHFAVSPKLGLNLRYMESDGSSGHAWFSASRTFKAPTLDQLFDQRPIPVPFPPFSLTTSNPDLNPQRGTSLESGIYHDVSLDKGHLSVTLTLYQIAMKDELDFDVQTLRYVNIGRSRHRGVEGGLSFSRSNASAYVSLTLQDAIARAGDNRGNRLKAIPGQIISTGVTLSPASIGTLSLSLTRTADMFIDDANTRRIPSWTRVDAQASRRFGYIEMVLGARNLLGKQYNSTGFLDPSGSGEAYWYPAAGRVITLGVRNGR